MSEGRGAYYLGFLLVGMGIGAGLALLFAPQSGKDTRRYLARRAEEGKDYVTSAGKDLLKQAEGVVERGKDWATKFA
jgi:gas vesicle protein